MHFQSVKYKDIVHGWNGQNSHSLLLPQHAASCTQPCSQDPAPSARWGTPGRAVLHVTHEGKQKEEAGSNICPPHDPCYSFRVDGVRGEQQAGYQGPVPITKQNPGEVREKACDGSMQEDVYKVVAPRVHSPNSVVNAEGKCAERSVGLVAPAVSKQRPPKVVVEDVDPRCLRQKVLVCLDSSTTKDK